jgi:hypothetical protein
VAHFHHFSIALFLLRIASIIHPILFPLFPKTVQRNTLNL